MVKSKIEDNAIKDLEANFENGAKLKQNKKAGRPKKEIEDVEKILNIYNVPRQIVNAIKELHIPFSVYAKIAIEEKLQRDGIL